MSNAKYKVTVEKIEFVSMVERKGYAVLGTSNLSPDEYRSIVDDNERRRYKPVAGPNETTYYTKDEYGYPPDREYEQEKTTKIFEQILDGLNLAQLVTTINAPPQFKIDQGAKTITKV